MKELGVNIDHVATLRQARGETFPDPIEAAQECEKAGCHSIVAHLREDRRHINDDDIRRLNGSIKTHLNMEMSCSDNIVAVACAIKPRKATLVPEKRQELTTEGGLDLLKNHKTISEAVKKLHREGIQTSLFIDPDEGVIERVSDTGSSEIEIHTGAYAQACLSQNRRQIELEISRIRKSAEYAREKGLRVDAGHGLDLHNIEPIAAIGEIEEYNIGYSIIARSIFVGINKAVSEMLELINSKVRQR